MLKIRRSRDRLIFNMGIPLLVRQHIYIDTPPASLTSISQCNMQTVWWHCISIYKAGRRLSLSHMPPIPVRWQIDTKPHVKPSIWDNNNIPVSYGWVTKSSLSDIITLQCDIWPLCDFSALPMSLFGPANVTFRPWGCSLPVAPSPAN